MTYHSKGVKEAWPEKVGTSAQVIRSTAMFHRARFADGGVLAVPGLGQARGKILADCRKRRRALRGGKGDVTVKK
jgi:hypothetical protein